MAGSGIRANIKRINFERAQGAVPDHGFGGFKIA